MTEKPTQDCSKDMAYELDKEACESVVEHIFEYLDSEMTEEDTARVRAHVAECSPCLAELSIDELIKAALKRSCSERAPEHLRVRIRAQFTQVTITEG